MAVFAGLAALGLLTAAGGAGTNDYASGTGHVQPAEDRWISIGFEAEGTGLTATGEFDFDRRNRGQQGSEGFHADVTCLNVDGEEAWMVIEIEQSNDDQFVEGSKRTVYVEDNGDGHSGDPDEFRIRSHGSGSDEPNECDKKDERGDEVRGDITVEEGGFAA